MRRLGSTLRDDPMIGKVTKGSSGRGLIRYLFGPGKANEHTDQRVITIGLALGGIADGRNLSSAARSPTSGRPSMRPTTPSARTRLGGHICHVSLSLPPAIAIERRAVGTRSPRRPWRLWASRAKE